MKAKHNQFQIKLVVWHLWEQIGASSGAGQLTASWVPFSGQWLRWLSHADVPLEAAPLHFMLFLRDLIPSCSHCAPPWPLLLLSPQKWVLVTPCHCCLAGGPVAVMASTPVATGASGPLQVTCWTESWREHNASLPQGPLVLQSRRMPHALTSSNSCAF